MIFSSGFCLPPAPLHFHLQPVITRVFASNEWEKAIMLRASTNSDEGRPIVVSVSVEKQSAEICNKKQQRKRSTIWTVPKTVWLERIPVRETSLTHHFHHPLIGTDLLVAPKREKERQEHGRISSSCRSCKTLDKMKLQELSDARIWGYLQNGVIRDNTVTL